MPQIKCKICQKEFYIKPSHQKLGYGIYCSIKCRRIGQKTGRMVVCEICGKEAWKTPKDFKNSKSGKFFCSKSCQTKWRNGYFSGDKHYFWKGGGYIYRNKLLKSGIKQLCAKCENNDIRVLEAHHIDKDRKNNNIENLVWLCKNCHFLVHNYKEKI